MLIKKLLYTFFTLVILLTLFHYQFLKLFLRKTFFDNLSFQRSPSRNASNVPSERVNIQGHSEENTNQTTDHLKTAELNREGRILLSDEEEKHEKQDALYRSRGKVTFSLPPTRPPTVEKIEQSKI